MDKLTIIRCKEEKGKITALSGDANTFKATINPDKYTRNYERRYTGGEDAGGSSAIGKSSAVTKYAKPVPEKLGFTITLDGTGVIPDAVGVTVADQVKQLLKVAYDYVGDEHEPPPVKVSWGSGLEVFYGRMQDLNVDYTLFNSSGAALRATVKLDFIEAITETEEATQARRKSPDLTHLVRVREGDTLPLLCQRVYKDVSKYLEIARLNDLDNFRDLKPNTMLRFPPMR